MGTGEKGLGNVFCRVVRSTHPAPCCEEHSPGTPALRNQLGCSVGPPQPECQSEAGLCVGPHLMGPSDLGCGVAASVCQASLSALLRHGRRGSPGKLAAPPGGRALSQRFIEPALAMSRCALPGPEPIQALLPGTFGDSLDIVPAGIGTGLGVRARACC